MTENEAASTPEPSEGSERPRPRYGELAPEGWAWQPPQPVAPEPEPTSGTTAVKPQTRYPAPTTQPHNSLTLPQSSPAAPHSAPSPDAAKAPAALRTDRRITMALLIMGLVGVLISVSTLNAIPDALQMLHEQEGLEPFVASAGDLRTIFIGTVLQGALWAATAVWAWLRMQNARRAFWIPLVGGAASVVLLFAIVSMVAATDPQLMQLYGAL